MGVITDIPISAARIPTDAAGAVDAAAALRSFRGAVYGCLTSWADALFELSDAVLCAPGPVSSVPTLSLEPTFRRGAASTRP